MLVLEVLVEMGDKAENKFIRVKGDRTVEGSHTSTQLPPGMAARLSLVPLSAHERQSAGETPRSAPSTGH